MFAVSARYRGRSIRRAELVTASAEALSGLPGIGTVSVEGIEDISSIPDDAEGTTTLVMALLSAGEWAVSIGIAPDSEEALTAAHGALSRGGRAGAVHVRIRSDDPAAASWSGDIAAAFALLSHVISRRSPEGREAAAFLRAGFTQVEAAKELGVSKQAVNQRLAAAGWQAEEAGWSLAVNLLSRANEL